MSEARQTVPNPPRAMGAWLPELRDPPLVTARATIRAYRHPGTGPGAMCVALDTHENEAYAWTCASDATHTSGGAPVHSVSADGDTAFTLDSDDAEMASARRLARCTLAEFGRRFKSRPGTQTELSLKGRFRDVTGIEYLWIDVFEIAGDTLFRGTVANDPAAVKHLKYGDTVAVPAADVADWFAVDQDTLVAGFTLRIYRLRLGPAERARADSTRGYAVTDDSDAHRRLTSRCGSSG